MGKIPLKTLLCALFCAGVVVYLGGCVDPVDLAAFVSDPEVAQIIERGDGTVKLTHDSDADLQMGNKKITGLDPHKYYMVEEWDIRGNPVSVQLVAATGKRCGQDVAQIGAVTGKEITGLTNDYNYRVKAAGPLPGNVSYSVLTSSGSIQSAPNTNGVIYLPEPEDDSFIIYTLTPPSPPPDEIIELPISPAGSAKAAMRSPNGDIITLISRKTVTDYVFFGAVSNELFNFYILKVTSGENPEKPPEPGDVTITVTLSYTGDGSPGLTPTSQSYHQNDTGTITFTVANPIQYSGFIWYVDGAPMPGTGSSFILNKDNIEYKIVGEYTITVIASKGGIPYAAAIKVEVLP